MQLEIETQKERQERAAVFQRIVHYINEHQGCSVREIQKGAGLSPIEAATYLCERRIRFYKTSNMSDFQWVLMLQAGGIERVVNGTPGIFINESRFGDLRDYAERFGVSIIALRGKLFSQREDGGIYGSPAEPSDDAIDEFEAFENSMERRLRDE